MCVFVSPLTLPLTSIVRVHIPLGASAVVFAVPCPLEGHRPDVSAVPGGIVRMDVSRCSPRRFHILLPFDQVISRVRVPLLFFILRPQHQGYHRRQSLSVEDLTHVQTR